MGLRGGVGGVKVGALKVPYAHLTFPRPRFDQRPPLSSDFLKETFGRDVLITRHGRCMETLLPGMEPERAVEKIRDADKIKMGGPVKIRVKGEREVSRQS